VARKIVDTILPTTMVGSYPRPKWFNYQLLGKDVRVAFKHVDHAEAYADATVGQAVRKVFEKGRKSDVALHATNTKVEISARYLIAHIAVLNAANRQHQ